MRFLVIVVHTLENLYIGGTSYGRHKIIGLSHVRMIPTTCRPWEHDGAHCLIRKYMPKNNEDRTYIIEPEIGLYKLDLQELGAKSEYRQSGFGHLYLETFPIKKIL